LVTKSTNYQFLFFKNEVRIIFFYARRYPHSLIKAPLLLLFKPKKFFLRLRSIEKIVLPILPNSHFNLLDYLSMNKILKVIKILYTRGPVILIQKIKEKIIHNDKIYSINEQYQIWLKNNLPTKSELKNQKIHQKNFIIMRLYIFKKKPNFGVANWLKRGTINDCGWRLYLSSNFI